MARVTNVSAEVRDLSDGRMLAPGESADDVDTTHPHQRGLVTDGHLRVDEGPKPRRRGTTEEVIKAAEAVHEDKEG